MSACENRFCLNEFLFVHMWNVVIMSIYLHSCIGIEVCGVSNNYGILTLNMHVCL